MADIFSRTEILLGKEAVERLKNAHVAVFGIGGVGGHAAEALIRSGVGRLTIVDNDTVSITNINRQIIALHSTVGMLKTDVAKARFLDINPDADIRAINAFYTPENADMLDFTQFDYVVDAIDTVKGKIGLVMQANEANVPIICSMGAGNKIDPTRFVVSDIYKTSVCPLARVMRTELKKRGIKKLKVVYSAEPPVRQSDSDEELPASRRQIPGSCAFVPSVVGLIIAGEVVKEIVGIRD